MRLKSGPHPYFDFINFGVLSRAFHFISEMGLGLQVELHFRRAHKQWHRISKQSVQT